jgi:hypothetical protein
MPAGVSVEAVGVLDHSAVYGERARFSFERLRGTKLADAVAFNLEQSLDNLPGKVSTLVAHKSIVKRASGGAPAWAAPITADAPGDTWRISSSPTTSCSSLGGPLPL